VAQLSVVGPRQPHSWHSSPYRTDRPVRYALVISLRTAETGVDLHTSVANVLHVPVEVPTE
jgi:hypothetical protein